MQFTLTHDGRLPGSKRNPRPQQAIREALHPQLVELWRHEPLWDRHALLKPEGTTELSVLVGRGGQFYAALVHDNRHTLLQDDRLITRVTVETDRLLEQAPADWNRALIRVTVKARRLIYGNIDLGS